MGQSGSSLATLKEAAQARECYKYHEKLTAFKIAKYKN